MSVSNATRHWDRLDDGLLPYALAASRAIWLWLLLQLFVPLTTSHTEILSPFFVFGLLAVSTLCMQLALFWVGEGRGVLLVSLGGVAAVLVTLYAAFGTAISENSVGAVVVVLLAVWCWRWGILAGQELLSYETYVRNFFYGVIALAFIAIVASAAHLIPLGALILPTLLFFALSLGMLALAGMRTAQRYGSVEMGAPFALNRAWLGTVGAIVAVMVLIGLVLGSLFEPSWVRGVLAVINLLWQALVAVLLTIAYVIVFVFLTIANWIGRLINFTPLQDNPPPIENPVPLEPAPAPPLDPFAALPPEVFLLLQIAILVLLGLLIALVFAWAFRRTRQSRDKQVNKVRESVFSMDLLQQQLARLLRRNKRPGESDAEPFTPIHGDDPPAQIRRTYQQLLGWAAARGVTRQAGETPLEFERTLSAALPIERALLATITSAYLNARYSRVPLTPQDAEQVASAWRRILRAENSASAQLEV